MENKDDHTDTLGISCKALFLEFLKNFKIIQQDKEETKPIYQELAIQLYFNLHSGRNTAFPIDYSHLDSYDVDFAIAIKDGYYAIEPYLNIALKEFMIELDINEDEAERFHVSIHNLPLIEQMRCLNGKHVGRLLAFSGRVTRTSEVRPELYLAQFSCLECSAIISNIVQEFKLTQPTNCINPQCKNISRWSLIKSESRFIDWQRVRIQENNKEIPPGSTPRTMEIILRNELAETIRPGDSITLTGTLLVIPDVSIIANPGERVSDVKKITGSEAETKGLTGPVNLGCRELHYKFNFLVSHIEQMNESNGAINIRGDKMSTKKVELECSESQLEQIRLMSQDKDIYEKMARSIAPNIYGNEDLKKAILLMLVGGMHKITKKEGINIRGDINILIVGDASCGKSQLLKYVANFVPRAVYISGKSSSAAGLTASVVKESEGGEFCIQAGALMLADNSICCMDEFDKMDQKDQVAIHEAMEQQTISISKAGIHATLNSRASILAAANPLNGRYDERFSIRKNVALSAPLLSRFDLLYIMVDKPDVGKDTKIAEHITKTHREGIRRESMRTIRSDICSKTDMQLYIKYIRTIEPKITPEVIDMMQEAYVKLRKLDTRPGSKASYRITIRQLEGLIRLSEALARIHCSKKVTRKHVKEATRLIENSVNTLISNDVDLKDFDNKGNGTIKGIQEQIQIETNILRQMTITEHMPGRSQENVNVEVGQESQRQSITKINTSTYETIKRIIVAKLQKEEEEVVETGEKVLGMKQKDFLEWYFKEHLVPMNLSTNEIHERIMMLQKLIGMLIFKDHVLIGIEPMRNEEETENAYETRKIRERILCVNSNYQLLENI